ncbi:MaoC family dehydratase N-terminal domain-containing protein [Candidimonas nitroreducens]|uniref:MaoC family dehydratase N-terminal domain-containing protein n=1 Tax=Candidimonas nitroreducens TaxID=683354 RepID=UPI0018EA11B5
MDIAHLQRWIGRQVADEDVIGLRQALLMAATVNVDTEKITCAGVLPPLWHWLYFLEGAPAAELGPDGHASRGGFLPPVPLRNRMWAGGRVNFLRPLPFGSTARKESRILDVCHKTGRAGDLIFVTVEHRVSVCNELYIREEHDIVYRNAGPIRQFASTAKPLREGNYQRSVQFDSVMLFRYSALTFNGHRIHYDGDYCRNEEGYSSQVIHGPLNATLLAGFAEALTGRPLCQFDYRGHAPATLGDSLIMHADLDGGGLRLSSRFADGRTCMSAWAN